MQHHVPVQTQVPRDFHGERNSHRGDGRHDVDLVGLEDLRQFLAGALQERHADVDGNEKGEGEIVVE